MIARGTLYERAIEEYGIYVVTETPGVYSVIKRFH